MRRKAIRKLDLTGQRFGRLTVMHETEPYVQSNGKRLIMWHCLCDCNNKCDVPTGDLRSGHTKSCGCMQKDNILHINNSKKKVNKYDVDTNKYGIGYDLLGNEFYFDKEDYEKIKDFYWSDKHGYVVTQSAETRKMIHMHRLIMDVPNDKDVDHINHNKKDNRKQNLRIVSRQENMCNTSMKSNNKSGVTGIHFDKRFGKWIAQIGYKGKKIYLGSFLKFDDAVKVRKEAEEKYFGEYSYDNSIKIAKSKV